jgi:hypothetical protein
MKIRLAYGAGSQLEGQTQGDARGDLAVNVIEC